MATDIIDLHCDTFGRITDGGPPLGEGEDWSLATDELHFCLSRRPEGVRICQAAAIFIKDELRGKAAQDYFFKAYGVYKRELSANGPQACGLCDLRFIAKRLEEKPMVFFLTVEGGAVLGGDIAFLDTLRECGVRMMTLTWNGANELCGGIVSGGGFTPFGRAAVARMEELGMAVDVSHLSDEGFWELCEFAVQPFLASHSNSRSVCGHRRNLTDDMFREIVRRGGVVGLNYSVHFIVDGGATADFNDLARHIHHFLELGGENSIALGSDFDGTDLPPYLSGLEKLDTLKNNLLRNGIGEAIAEKILFGNANRFLSSIHRETVKA
ncbi:MAG: membrane dipeptidase [Oscillospiraceae bacterium]|jgi:membrane dipeptidase|nr:membrane dipeptidase [Oscillospiraceae bacterium]